MRRNRDLLYFTLPKKIRIPKYINNIFLHEMEIKAFRVGLSLCVQELLELITAIRRLASFLLVATSSHTDPISFTGLKHVPYEEQ